jgi:signal transduction histidine kinase
MKTLADLDLAALFDDWSNEGLRLESFLSRVTEGCVAWFGAARASLFLRADYTGDYILEAQAGNWPQLPEHSVLRAGEGIAGTAIQEGKPRLVQTSTAGISSAMIIPLVTVESGCIGVLNVARSDEQPAFGDAELRLASTLGRYVALAVNNARLFVGMNQAIGQTRALNAKLDAIIANLGVGVLVVSEFEEITGWNPEAYRLFGERIHAGTHLTSLLKHAPLVLRIAMDQAFGESINGNRASRRAFDQNTGKAWTVVSSPLPAGGATLAVQDVSDHEHAQRELSRVKRLAEIGQMTAAVAHEIRNPLTGIRSAAQMVQQINDEAGEFGKIIEEEALKLNSLCDQFLEFARPLQLNPREMEPAEIAKRVCDAHRSEFEAASVELETEFQPGKTQGDPLRYEQVLRNLLLNALQACTAGATVFVDVSPESMTIRDTGVGMDPAELDQLFTPFFTTKPSGTGLGLSTVRKIADAHGWRISVESTPGQGTRFELDLEKAA